jgi:hypothetical protein
MAFTADTESGGFLDDPTPAQLEALIAGLGTATGGFVTIGPDSDDADWYATIRLLPDGTTEIERSDPATGETSRAAATGTPAAIARDLTGWIITRR